MLAHGRTSERVSADSHKHNFPRRKFTLEEDERLRTLVGEIGTSHWDSIASLMPNRSARQCRDRYKNYLLESIVVSPWRPEEDEIIRIKFAELGPRWVEIAKCLIGRSGNHVKNRWHKHLCRRPAPQQPIARLPPIDDLPKRFPQGKQPTPGVARQVFPQLDPNFEFPFRNPFISP